VKRIGTDVQAAALVALVARAKAGEADALEALVGALQHDVYRLALRMTAHPEDAEDTTQEVLVKVVTRLESFRGEASVRTWAYRIAVHHILDRCALPASRSAESACWRPASSSARSDWKVRYATVRYLFQVRTP
jgi:RNA polymerase sigma factor (sigma-70 family)